jgi:Xaa-Pro aminopeptidase
MSERPHDSSFYDDEKQQIQDVGKYWKADGRPPPPPPILYPDERKHACDSVVDRSSMVQRVKTKREMQRIWGASGVSTLFLTILVLVQLFHVFRSPTAKSIDDCAWSYTKQKTGLLDVKPITRDEFIERQQVLAAAISEAGVDAFIAEPSASSTYYANISSDFDLSERPFLMILDKEGQFSYLVPKFEANRIADLDMVYSSKKVIEWHEEESPYEALKRATGYKKIMLDEHVRFMIASGLEKADIDVIPVSEPVQSIRAVKSEAELVILRGINEFTVELVRGLQKCIKIGSTQQMILQAAEGLFRKAGESMGLDLLKGMWQLALLGESAANPHGGSKDAKLKDGEFVLIDIGTSLHGYGSDVTRTFLPKGASISDELLSIWHLVYDAQSAAIELMKVNETCSVVDAASREVISNAGYGKFFTHRLGHGLGLEVHEHPYLNGANQEKLRAGQVVTNEPVSRNAPSTAVSDFEGRVSMLPTSKPESRAHVEMSDSGSGLKMQFLSHPTGE